jgi:hypothetical protein
MTLEIYKRFLITTIKILDHGGMHSGLVSIINSQFYFLENHPSIFDKRT